jgi:hypothetical protein
MRVRSAPAFGVVTLSKAEDFWADSQGYLLPLLTLFVGNFLLHHFWCIGTASIESLLVVLGVVGALALAGTRPSLRVISGSCPRVAMWAEWCDVASAKLLASWRTRRRRRRTCDSCVYTVYIL